jgi:DNA-binding IclR family transcriptional regulator
MSDQAVLELFARTDGEPRTTPEVAAQLGISKPATWKRLTDLYEEGLLEKQPSSGLQSDAWSLSDAGEAALEGDSKADPS